MNVLIVDDQREIVEGMIQGICWEKFPEIRHVSGAETAKKAREIISAQKIDILLCDIEMPQEDGISLVRWIREKKITCECIFLTSHAEFNYAKEAVSLESFDYILKPARYETIEEVIRKAIIKRTKSQKFEILEHEEEYQDQTLDYFADSLLMKINEYPEEAASALSKIIKIEMKEDTDPGRIYIALWEILDSGIYERKSDSIRTQIVDLLKKLFIELEYKVIFLRYTDTKYILLLVSQDKRTENSDCIRKLQDYITYEQRNMKFHSAVYFYGCAGKADEFREIVRKLINFSKNNIMREAGVFVYSEDKISGEKSKKLLLNTQDWKELLSEGKGEIIINRIEEYYSHSWNHNNAESIAAIQKEFFNAVWTFLADEKINYDQVFDDQEHSLRNFAMPCETYGQLMESIKGTVYCIEAAVENERNKDLGQARVEKVIEYIRENAGSNITRSDVAKYMNFHEDTLSRIFKSETGYTIKEYINNERIRLAKKLLRTTDLSVSMVAIESGFSNFSHFTQVFKKVEGMTPTAYRNNRQ